MQLGIYRINCDTLNENGKVIIHAGLTFEGAEPGSLVRNSTFEGSSGTRLLIAKKTVRFKYYSGKGYLL